MRIQELIGTNKLVNEHGEVLGEIYDDEVRQNIIDHCNFTDRLEDEVAELEDQVNDLQKENNDLEFDNTSLTLERDDLQRRVDRLEDEVNSLQNENSVLLDELNKR